MEVTITQFRRDLFTLVNQAMEGTEVWVKHKGRRFRLEPEKPKGNKLARLTKRDYIINEDVPEDALLKEMTKAWEKTGMKCDCISRHAHRAMVYAR